MVKYSLACDIIRVKTDQGEETRLCSHVCIMDHVDKERIEMFFKDVRDLGAFPPQNAHESNHVPINSHLTNGEAKELNNNIYHK